MAHLYRYRLYYVGALLAVALAVLFPVIMRYVEKPGVVSPASTTKENAVVMPTAITKDQAVAIIYELPEIKAWSNYIEHASEGKYHAVMKVLPEELVSLNGKQYWTVNFYENLPAQLDRWESFLVSLDSQEIWVDNIIDNSFISLQEWRNSKKPMERIQGTNTPQQ